MFCTALHHYLPHPCISNMDYVYYITKCKNFKAHSVVLMKYKTGVSLRPEVTTASCPIGIPPSVVPLFLTCIVSLRICRALFSGRFDIPASSINFFGSSFISALPSIFLIIIITILPLRNGCVRYTRKQKPVWKPGRFLTIAYRCITCLPIPSSRSSPTAV